MSNLSDKIRIVSSDGETLKEAKIASADKSTVQKRNSDPVEKESIIDRIKGVGTSKKNTEDVENDSSKDNPITDLREEMDGGSSDKLTVVNRVKDMLSRDRVELDKGAPRDHLKAPGDDKGFTALVDNVKRKKDDFFLDQEEKLKDGEEKSETPLLIAIVVALAVVGIVVFIMVFNSSSMAKVNVNPQMVDDPVIQAALDASPEEFENLLVFGAAEDDDIIVNEVDVEVDVEVADEVEEDIEEDDIIVDVVMEDAEVTADSSLDDIDIEIKALEKLIIQLDDKLKSSEGLDGDLVQELVEARELLSEIKTNEGLGE